MDDSSSPDGATHGICVSDIMWELNPNDLDKIVASIPATPMVTLEEWELIAQYYLSNSPDSILHEKRPINDTLSIFDPLPLKGVELAYVTLIQYDSISKNVYSGDRRSRLYQLDSSLTIARAVQLQSPPSHLYTSDSGTFISLMGIMDPNDQARGSIIQFDNGKTNVVIDSLQRPVFFELADFNNDGLKDYIVCEFGNFSGQLSIFEKTPTHFPTAFRKHIINPMPGARNVVLRDVNHDGLVDILALMSQGDEKIVMYTNQGDFKFEETTLARFLPVFGSSYFELVDMNNDGHEDLIYSNGDNADYSTILKSFHGIHIFINDGKEHFNETWSYPMYGASQVIAKDFDLDGNIDLAAISYFPDFINNPEMGFIYFENTGNLTFKPQISNVTKSGRWLVMNAADYDQDGDFDILLGAYNFKGFGASPETITQWENANTPVILLKNNTMHMDFMEQPKEIRLIPKSLKLRMCVMSMMPINTKMIGSNVVIRLSLYPNKP